MVSDATKSHGEMMAPANDGCVFSVDIPGDQFT
jgi:hypothetical protein